MSSGGTSFASVHSDWEGGENRKVETDTGLYNTQTREREKGGKKKKKTLRGKRARINETLHCVTDVSGGQ